MIKLFFKFLLTILIFGVISIVIYIYYIPGFHLKNETAIGMGKVNAVWIAHKWVEETHSKKDIHTLLTILMNNHVNLVFAHTGPIEPNGEISEIKYKQAKEFLKEARIIAPNIKFHAWIGQVSKKLPLEDSKIRHEIINISEKLINEVGFDGIHINIEPMQGDPNYQMLIKELREVVADAEISITISPIVPESYQKILKKILPEKKLFGYSLDKSYNTIKDIKKLAESVDYIVLMGYDTGFVSTKLYQWFIEQEMIFLTKAASGKAIIGIPTYEDDRENFNPDVENMANAMEGIKNGVANIRINTEKFAGVAIYSRWTTDDTEWKVWRNKWLNLN